MVSTVQQMWLTAIATKVSEVSIHTSAKPWRTRSVRNSTYRNSAALQLCNSTYKNHHACLWPGYKHISCLQRPVSIFQHYQFWSLFKWFLYVLSYSCIVWFHFRNVWTVNLTNYYISTQDLLKYNFPQCNTLLVNNKSSINQLQLLCNDCNEHIQSSLPKCLTMSVHW